MKRVLGTITLAEIEDTMITFITLSEILATFDEPAVKSYFVVTLVRKPQMVTLSNTPIKFSSSR
jgi:hypothetical protein